MCAQSLSRVRLFVTPRTVARQASVSMEFSRQENWSGLPFPPPGDLPNPGVKRMSPALAGRFFTTEPPGGLQTNPYGFIRTIIWEERGSSIQPVSMHPLRWLSQRFRTVTASGPRQACHHMKPGHCTHFLTHSFIPSTLSTWPSACL